MPFQVDGATSGDSMPETPADGEFRDMVTFEHTFVAAKGDDTLVNPAPFEYNSAIDLTKPDNYYGGLLKHELDAQIVPQLEAVETTAQFHGYEITECHAYKGTKFTGMTSHCQKLVKEFNTTAEQYKAMAAEHEKMAQDIQSQNSAKPQ